MRPVSDHDEDDQSLRSAALRSGTSILRARQRAEEEMLRAKGALELKTAQLDRTVAMLRATLEATTDGILVTDGEGALADFNQNFVRMWGLPPEAMAAGQQRRPFEFIRHCFPDPQRFVARVDQILASAEGNVFDLLETVDGRTIERFSRIQYVDGRDVGRVWSFRDITERRRAEEALEDETRILDVLNRSGTSIAATLDLQPLLQTVIDAATEISGARFGAFYYDTVDESGDACVQYAVSGAPREAFARFGQPGAPPLLESAPSYMAVPVISRAGKTIGGLYFGHPDAGVFNDRAQRMVVGVAAQASTAIDNARLYDEVKRVASERELLVEAERAARADLERAGRMKDEFLATLSHELRTPLTAILGWAKVLQRKSDDAPTLAQGIDTIARNARAQAQLIDDLLDMSRIIFGKVRLDVRPTDLACVVEAAVETVRPALQTKGIQLWQSLDPVAGPIDGDPHRLQQVVLNLLSNAVKFTPKGGAINVVLARANSQLRIAIKDSGVGINPEVLPHVFDRFRQADSSITRRYGGLGLGLSIVKQLVELHAGTVRAESAGEGLGATFIVTLPMAPAGIGGGRAADATAPAAASLALDEVDLSGVKVLVIDDEPDARELVGQMLIQAKAEVMMAGSAGEAMRVLEACRPDVMVSDIGMPGEDGYQFIREVRRLAPAKGGLTPAIALTAYARSEDRTRAMRAGFQVHVSKPVEPPELVAAVGGLAGRIASNGR